MRIVIVEDNETLANAIAHQLRDQGHSVNLLHDGQSALEFLRQEDFDIVIMDVNLPKIDGFTILKSLRRSENSVPVLLLTARGDIHDRVTGLDAGADDYLVKPFDMDELDARLRALIRRKPLIENEIVQFGSLSFDRVGRKLSVKGVDLDLPRRELAVFECLFERQNQIVSKTKIADHIYGVGADMFSTPIRSSSCGSVSRRIALKPIWVTTLMAMARSGRSVRHRRAVPNENAIPCPNTPATTLRINTC